MDIKDIIKHQIIFDKKLNFRGDRRGNFDDLVFNTIGIMGEVGEFTNLVKKEIRKKKYKRERKDERSLDREKMLREELIDIFIYFLKLSVVLGVDIEKEYFKKLKKVERRFK